MIGVTTRRFLRTLLTGAALALVLAACGNNMVDQPSVRALEATPFFAEGSANRPRIEGTVSRETGAIDPAFFTGQGPDGLLTDLPFELSVDVLRRGKERYDIYCAVCHGYTGAGDGMIVTRGFPAPTSFHAQRLLDAPVGYYFTAATNGFGRMFSYASRISTEDRWAIAGYVKALQLSQNATADDVPDAVPLESPDDAPQGDEGRVRR